MRILLTIVLSIFSVNTFACKCKLSSLEEHIKNSEFIFIAQIISVEEVNKIKGIKYDSSGVRAKFESSDTLKGNPIELDYLYSGYGGGDCGLQLQVGDNYMFFTKNGYVSICNGSEKNSNDLAKYTKIKKLAAKE